MVGKKNQVTLTFAGDADQLDRVVNGVGESARKMEDDVRGSTGRINQALGEGGRAFGDYGTGIGGVGDRFDEVDTRAMGLSDGIQGLNDIFSGGKLRPHEYAMAVSDLGSSMYNFVVPTVQDLGKKVGNLGTKFKDGISQAGGLGTSMKNLAPTMLGVAAGVGAITVGWQMWQSEQAKGRQQIQETRQALEDAHGDVTRLDDAFVTSRFEPWIEGLNEAGVTLDTLRLALSGNEEAIRAVEAASAGMGHAAGSQLRRMLDEGIGAIERENAVLDENAEFASTAGSEILTLGQRTQDTAADVDRMTGALDRLLGRFLDTDESIRRQNELVLGLDEHWRQMAEDFGGAAMALDNNTAAGIANRDMLDELIRRSSETTNVMREHGRSQEDVRAQWALDRAELSAVIERFRAAGMDVSHYDELLGNIDRRVNTAVSTTGTGSARHSIHLLGAEILSLPDHRSISVGVRLLTSTFGIFAPRHHAGGTFHAPQGRSEGLAMLLDGERVTRPGQPGHDGGRPLVINVHGSVLTTRQLIAEVRDELARGGFGGVR